MKRLSNGTLFVEITLDANIEGGNNENDTQLNTKTDDQPTKRPTDQPTKSEAMEITPNHPVYVEGKGWLWAENLVVGDRLRRSDGGWAKVLAVERVKLAEPQLVYNFTVKGPHTYFVLEVGVLVHNASPGCGLRFDDDGNPIGSGSFWYDPDYGTIYDTKAVEEIYRVLAETKEGRRLIKRVTELESQIDDPALRLLILFDPKRRLDNKVQDLAEYMTTSEHRLFLNAAFRNVPPEIAAPTLAHELSHRLRRWDAASLEDEILASQSGNRVWIELKDRPDLLKKLNNLPTETRSQAELIMKMHNEIFEASSSLSRKEFGEWLRSRSPSYEAISRQSRRRWIDTISQPEIRQIVLDQMKKYGP